MTLSRSYRLHLSLRPDDMTYLHSRMLIFVARLLQMRRSFFSPFFSFYKKIPFSFAVRTRTRFKFYFREQDNIVA